MRHPRRRLNFCATRLTGIGEQYFQVGRGSFLPTVAIEGPVAGVLKQQRLSAAWFCGYTLITSLPTRGRAAGLRDDYRSAINVDAFRPDRRLCGGPQPARRSLEIGVAGFLVTSLSVPTWGAGAAGFFFPRCARSLLNESINF